MHDLVKAVPLESATPPVGDKLRELTRLYANHWSELCRYIRHTFGAGPPDPQDIVQQTFLRFAALPSTEDVHNVRAYLFRTAHNILVEEHRRNAVGRAAVAELAHHRVELVEELTPERQLIGAERLELMRAVIGAQPPERRQSFLLHRLEGLSCAEIARRTGYSESGIKKHVLLVMAALEEALERAEAHRPGASPQGGTDNDADDALR